MIHQINGKQYEIVFQTDDISCHEACEKCALSYDLTACATASVEGCVKYVRDDNGVIDPRLSRFGYFVEVK